MSSNDVQTSNNDRESAPADKAKSRVVDAVTAPKQPPPESASTIWTRRLTIISFWAVAILLGLPIWWKTTTIHRATLPLQAMNSWADGKACRPEFPLKIAVEAVHLSNADAQNLLRTTQHAIDDHNDFSAHHLRLLLSDAAGGNNASQIVQTPSVSGLDNADHALTIRLVPSVVGNTPRAELHAHNPVLEVFYAPNQIPSSSSTSSPLATFIALELQRLYVEEKAILTYLLSSSSSAVVPESPTLSRDMMESLAKRTTRSVKSASTYHLTFSLFTPTYKPSDWAIEAALERHTAALLHALTPISNFTVDTQVQLYATFAPLIHEPEYDENSKVWTLRKEDLSGFINAAEWPLSPSIGEGPTVNFVLYVPSESRTPLVIKENAGDSWLVPQWGGVRILNMPTNDATYTTPNVLTEEMLEGPFFTFSNQLLSLLGVPETPASLPLRLSTLIRVRAASLLFSASSTLGSLARLTLALPSISIPDTVAESVDLTIAHLHRACDDLREGRFESALENSRVADREVEKAFFEPAMVGQVYFPDEHKVAVYLPLLGPVAVPLIMAAIKEIRKVIAKRRK
ncbi:MAG: GPI transamidase component [Bathelium mastoideum]|nr:MAG: GPI transamidase component [Bathelium mastoideum]